MVRLGGPVRAGIESGRAHDYMRCAFCVGFAFLILRLQINNAEIMHHGF
jgi:hypothetical protein